MQVRIGKLTQVREVRSVGGALRLAESVLLAGGRQQARLNAWAAVCENRRYAADRESDAPLPGGSGGAAEGSRRPV
ncbi:hypothetical protein [Saccharothrix sp. ST-888]|uniref:hypothetical protein n=1 Tax=Saccharothrix sp. ST-888 TaxID=1427391 RepID=UPI000AA9E0A2|nr:hypothetical protein [Saccharothrix sp. ST-888]